MPAIYTFFFRRRGEDGQFLPLFRICISTFLLAHFLSVGPDFNMLYSRNGLVPAEIGRLFREPFIPTLSDLTGLLQKIFHMPEQTSLVIFKFTYVVLCLFLFTGFIGRISAILLLIFQLMLCNGTYFYSYGVDIFTDIALFYCCIFPISNRQDINPSPYRKVLQLHLSIAYCFSGACKLIGHSWWNGESIWKALHLPFLNSSFHFGYGLMVDYPLIAIALGWGTIILELLYPVAIWSKRYRSAWLWAIVSMHLGIAIFLNLYFFSMLMIMLNLCAFLRLPKKNRPEPVDTGRVKRNIPLFGVILFHLSVIFLVSTANFIKKTDSYYNGLTEGHRSPPAYDYLHFVLTAPVLHQYTIMAGIHVGYDFFAPNVPYALLIRYSSKDKTNTEMSATFIPPLKQQESYIRYACLLDLFRDKLNNYKVQPGKSTLLARYMDVIIKSIGRNMITLGANNNVDHVTATLYLYDYPGLGESIAGEHQPSLISLESLEIHSIQ